MESRDKLILVYYIDIGNMDMLSVKPYIEEIADKLKDEGDNQQSYFIPIRGETRVECINPKLVDENEFQIHLKRLDEAKEQYDKVVKELTND